MEINETDRSIYIANARKIVLKLGTKVLLSHYKDVNTKRINQLIQDVVYFKQKGYTFSIVTSGAIGFGMNLLGIEKRPTALKKIQALASIGQSLLMEKWTTFFHENGVRVGQILLTYDIIENRKRFLYARDCFNALFEYDAVPIVNENDSVAVDELKFGDNDTLSALTANLIDADLLVLFTDTDGVFTKNPYKHRDAEYIKYIKEINDEFLRVTEDKEDELSTGGMKSKLMAARLAAESGTSVVITNGYNPKLRAILEGKEIGTFIKPKPTYTKKRKRWIFFNQRIKGKIIVDRGAEEALVRHSKSLLPGGVVRTEKDFYEGSIVGIFNIDNKMIGKGITYYSSKDIAEIKGKKTSQIRSIMGKDYYDEIIHRDNMVIFLRD